MIRPDFYTLAIQMLLIAFSIAAALSLWLCTRSRQYSNAQMAGFQNLSAGLATSALSWIFELAALLDPLRWMPPPLERITLWSLLSLIFMTMALGLFVGGAWLILHDRLKRPGMPADTSLSVALCSSLLAFFMISAGIMIPVASMHGDPAIERFLHTLAILFDVFLFALGLRLLMLYLYVREAELPLAAFSISSAMLLISLAHPSYAFLSVFSLQHEFHWIIIAWALAYGLFIFTAYRLKAGDWKQ